MQSPDLILEDQTKSKIAEPSPGPTARSVHYVASSAQGKEARPSPGRAIASERASARRFKADTQGAVSEGPVRVARFARAMLRTYGDPAHPRCRRARGTCSSGTTMSPRPGRGTAAFACRSRTSRRRCRARSRKSGSSTTSSFTEGDVLYVIDPFDFQVALDTEKAQRREKAADVQVKRVQAERRAAPHRSRHHTGGAAAIRRQRHSGAGGLRCGQAEVAQADINLQRTQVRSPVNGYVTNFLLRVGDYADAGYDQHLGDRCRQLLDRRLFRRNQDGAHLYRRSRRSEANGLPRSDHRAGTNRDPRHQRRQRRAKHPRPAQCQSGLHLGAAGPTRAGAHPDHACLQLASRSFRA